MMIIIQGCLLDLDWENSEPVTKLFLAVSLGIQEKPLCLFSDLSRPNFWKMVAGVYNISEFKT